MSRAGAWSTASMMTSDSKKARLKRLWRWYTDCEGGTTDCGGGTTYCEGGTTDCEGGTTDCEGGTTDCEGGTTVCEGGTIDCEGGTTVCEGGTIDCEGGTTDCKSGTTDCEGDCGGGTIDCEGGTTDCEGGTTDCEGGTTDCESGTTDCEGGTTDCEGGTTDCECGTTDCEGGTTDCEGGTTDCEGGTTDCGGDCEGGTTDCEGGTTDCGGGTTDCEGGTTVCEGGTIDCEGGTTDCEGGTTDCEGGTTDCEGGTTDCEGGTTDCEGGTTDCEGGTTDCEGGTTDCEGDTTDCEGSGESTESSQCVRKLTGWYVQATVTIGDHRGAFVSAATRVFCEELDTAKEKIKVRVQLGIRLIEISLGACFIFVTGRGRRLWSIWIPWGVGWVGTSSSLLVCLTIRRDLIESPEGEESLELGFKNAGRVYNNSGSQTFRDEGDRRYNRSNSTVQTTVWVVVDATSLTCNKSNLQFLHDSVLNVVIVSRDNQLYHWCRPPTCVQLTPRDCHKDLKPWSTSRISVCPSRLSGYLFAMSKEATGIVDTDCNISVNYITAVRHLHDEYSLTCLKYNGTGYFIPYDSIKALPIISRTCNNSTRENYTHNFNTFYLQEFVAVDIMQIFPFQERQPFSNHQNNNIPSGLPLVLQRSMTLVPFSDRTVYFSGLSLLLLFVHPGFPVWLSPLFRMLWLHAIRQNIDVSVGYLPVLVKDIQESNKLDLCSFYEDSVKNKSLRNIQVVDCVQKLKCEETQWPKVCIASLALQVFRCIGHLAANITLTAEEFQEALAAWVDDVYMVSGDFIHAITTSKDNRNETDMGVQVTFGSGIDDSLTFGETVIDQCVLRYMKEVCPAMAKNVTTIQHRWLHPTITDIALVISVDDRSLTDSIPYLEYVHRQYFLHIVYCGSSERRFQDFIEVTQLHHITYITGPAHDHTHLYSCLAHAMRLTFPVSGYLLIHEHVLLNTWKILDLPRNQVWLPRGFSKRAAFKTKSLNRWMRWNSKAERGSVVKVLDELNQYSSDANMNLKTKTFAQNFLRTYQENLQTDYTASDNVHLFYIPGTLRSDYITAASKISKYNVSANMAVPFIHFGLARADQVSYLPGSSLSGENSKRPWNYFLQFGSYSLYPFVPGVHLSSTSGSDFFCQQFLHEFFRPKS
ncbi:hypothetical protein Btru_007354 [Bulinus truncatus]|nr:hypothetical protein Btru_007354 [Bulinus truncatus]